MHWVSNIIPSDIGDHLPKDQEKSLPKLVTIYCKLVMLGTNLRNLQVTVHHWQEKQYYEQDKTGKTTGEELSYLYLLTLPHAIKSSNLNRVSLVQTSHNDCRMGIE